MNKAELVAQVARESDLSKDAAEKAVDATFKNIERALKGGDTVRIVGFGNFQVAQRKPRPVAIPAPVPKCIFPLPAYRSSARAKRSKRPSTPKA